MVYLSLKAINYLYNKRNEINFVLNNKFMKKYDFFRLKQLNEEIFTRINEKINDISSKKLIIFYQIIK